MFDFLDNNNNIYRTRKYIVKQCMEIRFDSEENNTVCSYDTFYRRTKQRDKEYENFFKDRKNINGKRLSTSMYARTYVD